MILLGRPRGFLIAAIVIVGLVILHQVWRWEVERVEVGPGEFLVQIHRWGRDLPEDQIVAPDASYKGVMLDVLMEGRHFLNPLFWTYKKEKMKEVPPGHCLVLIRQYGKTIPQERIAAGDFLAKQNPKNPSEAERGILREVLGPGSHRINPYAYETKLVEAVQVRVDQVGVRTLKVGKDPRTLKPAQRTNAYLVPAGYRGVQQDPVPPGTYNLNPYVETIEPVEVRSHRVELSDIEFPSRDGFILKPHVVVEYAVQAAKAPELLIRLTDEGPLHQRDETPEQQEENEILQKVILPHIRGYARIEGSNFDARDFILVATAGASERAKNAREAMQRALLEKVKPRCEELGVDIRAVTLADLLPPKELSDQISQRELARVEQERNKVRLRQLKAEQDLEAKTALKQQAKEKVEAETRQLQAATRAEQIKEVEQARLKQDLANAKLRFEAAAKEAEATLSRGRADADVINLQNEAEVAGLRKAVQGFSSVQHFAQYHMLARIGPALSEIFASDTSDFAKVFADYMTQGINPGRTAARPTDTAADGGTRVNGSRRSETTAPPR